MKRGEKDRSWALSVLKGVVTTVFLLLLAISKLAGKNTERGVSKTQNGSQKFKQTLDSKGLLRQLRLLTVVGGAFFILPPLLVLPTFFGEVVEEYLGISELENEIRNTERALADLESGISRPILLLQSQSNFTDKLPRVSELTLDIMDASLARSKRSKERTELKGAVDELYQLRLKSRGGIVPRSEFISKIENVRKEAFQYEIYLRTKYRNKVQNQETVTSSIQGFVVALQAFGLFLVYLRDGLLVRINN